ncbi:MAG: peptidase M16 [Cytophagales bacterium CG18_big_fil_WC_8_21_14_2_50_42_9]|nr:MAG: peptidase M16 [Cytophagales bacterium CG18_big_fil_WC_8_21_14_2_50_42_9]
MIQGKQFYIKSGFRFVILSLVFFLTQCKSIKLGQTTSDTLEELPAKEKTYPYTSVNSSLLQARVYKLANGLTVYLSDNKDAPRIQAFIAVRAGSKNDPATATGVAHYLEHMMFKGTSRIGTRNYRQEKIVLDEIEQLFESYRTEKDTARRKQIYHQIDSLSGIAATYVIPNEYKTIGNMMGASLVNAYTSLEQTVYTGEIPTTQLERWAMVETERFREMVPRTFHTELEAVFEEKNRSESDNARQMFQELMGAIYPGHPYGQQTTIGTTEHLKNPSITEIKNFFATYYVPNNMALCLSGDLNLDSTIQVIDKYFGKLQPKPLPETKLATLPLINQPIIKEIKGPFTEDLLLGFRFPGVKTREALVLKMINKILYNGRVGLFDQNLRRGKAVLHAYAFDFPLTEYSLHVIGGSPRKGQKLEEVKDLFLEQIELIKQGKFEDWLIPAIANNTAIEQMKAYETNKSRVNAFVNAFISGQELADYIKQMEDFGNITKQEVMAVANKYYGQNYAVIYKLKGETPLIQEVEKTAITALNFDREAQSDFFKEVIALPTTTVKPIFLDYKKEITALSVNEQLPLYYRQNKDNGLFSLHLIWDNTNDPLLSLSLFLDADKDVTRQFKQDLYKLGCSISIGQFNSAWFTLSLSGLDVNFEKALALFENYLQHFQVNKVDLAGSIADLLKERENTKTNRIFLEYGITKYIQYGSKNPFNNELSAEELKKITSQKMETIRKNRLGYKHRLEYFGPRPAPEVAALLEQYHKTSGTLKLLPTLNRYSAQALKEPKVYFVDVKSMQAEIYFLSRPISYDKQRAPAIMLYNQYFGEGMNSVFWQELREKKGLAYATSSTYGIADFKDQNDYIYSYMGTQPDKLPEALAAMQNLLNKDMPYNKTDFNSAKENIINNIASQRITRESILYKYMDAIRLGLDYDIRQDIYEKMNSLKPEDIQQFHQQYVKGQNPILIVIGSKKAIDFKVLQKYGKIVELTLNDIYGF